MGRTHRQMNRDDRVKMETLLNAGHSISEVAQQLHFHRSNIYREYARGKYMHRNSDYTEEERYSADLGQERHEYAQSGKGRPQKIGNDMKLALFIERKIADEKYSPEAALAEANKVKNDFTVMISLRTLYRYIDEGVFFRVTNKDLPIKGIRKRHNHKVRVQKRASAGESIEHRPEEVDSREVFGHWEMDTVKGKKGLTKSCVLVLSERKTREEIVIKMPNQGSQAVVDALDNLERKIGDKFYKIFKSITVDNGVEFADYEGMERSVLKMGKRTSVYYCHAYSSWERGTNENTNRLVRRHAPKGTDFDKLTDGDIQYIENWINNYPRKILDYRTSGELFTEEVEKMA